MLRSLVLGLAVAITLTLAVAGTSSAGGWAITTFDSLPSEIKAGETYVFGFIIRQHGDKPHPGLSPKITFTSAAGETVVFRGRDQGAPGHYAAEVRLPSPGEWTWEIEQDWFGVQPLGTLRVLHSASGARPAEPRQADGARDSGALRPLVPIVALGASALGGLLLVVMWRGRGRRVA